MADLKFTVTLDNVKEEMNKVWQMANKGLKSGAPVIVTLGRDGTTDLQRKMLPRNDWRHSQAG